MGPGEVRDLIRSPCSARIATGPSIPLGRCATVGGLEDRSDVLLERVKRRYHLLCDHREVLARCIPKVVEHREALLQLRAAPDLVAIYSLWSRKALPVSLGTRWAATRSGSGRPCGRWFRQTDTHGAARAGLGEPRCVALGP